MNQKSVNANMVAIARESRGWTQRDLASAIGVEPSTMSRYEAGLVPISEETGWEIASRLRYDFSLLEQTWPTFSLGGSLIFHRKRARVPAKAMNRAQAEINVRIMQVRRLLIAADVQRENRFPTIPPEEFGRNPERVARELKRIWNIPDGPVSNLTQIIEANGGIVIQMDFGTRLIDGAHLHPPGMPPMFFVNTTVSGERYRYSLAHELGHAIMHHAAPIGEIEDEANKFAAELLMPRSKIRQDLRDLTLDSALRLKTVWRVSAEAIVRRAKDLRIITKTRYQYFCRMLRPKGSGNDEAFPLPIEEPGIFGLLVQFHRDELGYSKEEMDELIFVDPSRLGPLDPVTDTFPRLKLTEPSLFGE